MTSNLRDKFKLNDDSGPPVNEIATCTDYESRYALNDIFNLKALMKNDKKFYELVCPCSQGDQFKCPKDGCNNQLLFYKASPNKWCPFFSECKLNYKNEGACYFYNIDAGKVIKK